MNEGYPRGVFQRTLQDAMVQVDKWQHDHLGLLRSKRVRLEKELRTIKPGLCDIAHLNVVSESLESIERQSNEAEERRMQPWLDRIAQLAKLKNPSQAALVVLNNIMGNNSNEHIVIDPFRCSCSRPYHFEVTLHINTCLKCKIIKEVLNQAEDTQHDHSTIRNQRMPSSTPKTNVIYPTVPVVKPISESKKRKKESRKKSSSQISQTSQASQITQTSQAKPRVIHHHQQKVKPEPTTRVKVPLPTQATGVNDRSPTYRRYLMQFIADSPDLPEEVFIILYQDFSSIHMLNSLKCRPTSVVTILKAHNMLNYAAQSIRIARIFNGEPVPQLPLALIDKCVQRFMDVSECVVHLPNFGKLPSFEILTHLFLRAEGRDDLAAVFFLNKTSILRTAASKIHKLIEGCREYPKSRCNWQFIPHTIE